jgi:K+-transporting ATPase ATPase A chain
VAQGFLQLGLFFALVTAVVPFLGAYMARVFTGETTRLAPVEHGIYRLLRIDPAAGQDWKAYARSVLAFSAVGWLVLYLILRTQAMHPDLTFNTASSFVTNTNWQYYAGETALSGFSQMIGLAVQNFLSAAVGLAVAVALIRGLVARRERTAVLGNFWQDLIRVLLYVLLPISVVGALVLVTQGVPQSMHLPVASQEAIKELGTNGGGFFNVNSAFPFENPTAF